MSPNAQSNRVLSFLQGCTHPDVVIGLREAGFGQESFDEGWQRLREHGAACFALSQGARARTNGALIEALDQWENRWFPVIEVTLKHRYPALHKKVFLNLQQVSNIEIILTLTTLLKRLQGLRRTTEGKHALALLEQRGVTDPILSRARELLDTFGKNDPSCPPSEEALARVSIAEKQLWSWYLEWSQIARSTLKNKSALSALGFSKKRGRPPKKAGTEQA